MDFLKDLILPPAAEHLGLLPYLAVLLLMLHLPFAGITLMAGLASLLLRKIKPALAGAFFDLLPRQPGLWLVLGILPVFGMLVVSAQQFYNLPASLAEYWTRLLFPVTAGYLLMLVYRRSGHPVAGAAASLLLLVSLFFLASTLALTLSPDAWAFIRSPLPMVFSVTVLVHFLILLVFSLLATGVVLLFMNGRWPDRDVGDAAGLDPLLTAAGAGMVLAGAVALPVLLVWDYFTLPVMALSTAGFLSGLLLLPLAFGLASGAAVMLTARKAARPVIRLLVLAVLATGLLAYRYEVLQSTSSLEYGVTLAAAAGKSREEWKARREALYASNQVADSAAGEKIYNEKCSACHHFDKKLVGPAYYAVLPKYRGKAAELKEFIRNPRKIDPAFIAMPAQGLSEPQLASVTAYLLQKLEEQK